MLIIAERINASRKQIAHAISTGDRAFIQGEAMAQAQAGAHYIDVNAGTFVGQEADKLKWIVEAVQEVTELPLSIDSPDAEVIKAVMPLLKKTPLINSITLEPSRIDGILPLIVAHKTKVIALCQSVHGSAETTELKVALAGQLVEKLTGAGVPLDDIYIDPLVFPCRPIHSLPIDTGCDWRDHEDISGRTYDLRPDQCLLRAPREKAGQPGLSCCRDHQRAGFSHHRPDGPAPLCDAEGRHTRRRQR